LSFRTTGLTLFTLCTILASVACQGASSPPSGTGPGNTGLGGNGGSGASGGVGGDAVNTSVAQRSIAGASPQVSPVAGLQPVAPGDVAGVQSAAPVVFPLAEQNGSAISGQVALFDLRDGRTRVTITIGSRNSEYPAHIHEGTCANLNPAPAYPLENVRTGVSNTDVIVSTQDLLSRPMAVNLHRSAQQMSEYVACADLGRGM
jgi:hypothetical protein